MTITIHLHEPNKETHDVTVHPSDAIQVLQQEVQGNDRRFILFNNNILMTSFSFKFFGIKDGDDIYVLRSPKNNTKLNQKKRSTSFKGKNTHSYIKMANGNIEAVDKSAAYECIRLLDLLYIQDQIRPFPNRRLQVSNINEEKTPTNNQEVILEANKRTEPSTESLPIFWSNRKGRSLQSSVFV